MLSEEKRELVRTLYEDFQCYREVARILKISQPTVRRIVLNLHKHEKKKLGRPPKITSRQTTAIKRSVESINRSGQRVTSKKIQSECQLTHVSDRTVRSTMRRMNLDFKKAINTIVLTKKHQQKRLDKATEWIADAQQWSKVVFSDEKRFNMDGPDSWSSWVREGQQIVRNKRQQGGVNVQVWGMLTPNHYLMVFKLDQRSKSKDYIKFLSSTVKPILDASFDEDYILQQDNASIHVSSDSLGWMDRVGLTTMGWPSKSPDMNIIENCWHMIAARVYDCHQHSNKDELWAAIQAAVEEINENDRDKLIALTDSIPRRLLEVIKKKGGMSKY